MPPYRHDHDHTIMKHLSDTKVLRGVGKSYPYLTFTDLVRRTGINRVTLSQRLKGLLERRKIIKRTEHNPEPRYVIGKKNRRKYRVDRRYRTFYRVNPETNGELDRRDDGIVWYPGENAEQKRKSEKNEYLLLSWQRSEGHIVRTGCARIRGSFRIEKLLPASSPVSSELPH